jgi:hypothetical protein
VSKYQRFGASNTEPFYISNNTSKHSTYKAKFFDLENKKILPSPAFTTLECV